ncbi:MAG: DivIVA domain-containing protein [Anaerovoracaceae bacterium]
MILPIDIQHKEFSKGIRGYKEEEIDSFLDQITIDYDKVLSENARLKDEIDDLRKEINEAKIAEGNVYDTLESAKALMEEISGSAEKRAKILLKNAELDAELTVRTARDNASRLIEETSQMKTRYEEFKHKYSTLLASEIERFDTLTSELFPDFENEKLEEIMSMKEGQRDRRETQGMLSDNDLKRKTSILSKR